MFIHHHVDGGDCALLFTSIVIPGIDMPTAIVGSKCFCAGLRWNRGRVILNVCQSWDISGQKILDRWRSHGLVFNGEDVSCLAWDVKEKFTVQEQEQCQN